MNGTLIIVKSPGWATANLSVVKKIPSAKGKEGVGVVNNQLPQTISITKRHRNILTIQPT